jgi:hypothetical protein
MESETISKPPCQAFSEGGTHGRDLEKDTEEKVFVLRRCCYADGWGIDILILTGKRREEQNMAFLFLQELVMQFVISST